MNMSKKNNGLPDYEKSFGCWNDCKNDYIIYDSDELDTYKERWYIKNRKKLIRKMSM